MFQRRYSNPISASKVNTSITSKNNPFQILADIAHDKSNEFDKDFKEVKIEMIKESKNSQYNEQVYEMYDAEKMKYKRKR